MKTTPILGVLLLSLLMGCELFSETGDAPDMSSPMVVEDMEARRDQGVMRAPTTLVLSPNPINVALDTTVTVRASLLDQDDMPISAIGDPPVWGSADPSIAVVDAEGVVTGLSVGTTELRVAAVGLTATAQVNVSETPIIASALRVTPDAVSLRIGDQTSLTAVVLDQANEPLQGAVVTFSTPDDDILQVTPNGEVTALAAGMGQVNVTHESLTASVEVQVTANEPTRVVLEPNSVSMTVGQIVGVRATFFDDMDQEVACDATWSVQDPQIADVNQAGEVKSLTIGTTTIRVACGGVEGSIPLDVTDIDLGRELRNPTVLKSWFRADLGVEFQPNGQIQSWTDVSGNRVKMATGGTGPKLVMNAVGGRPALEFAGDAQLGLNDGFLPFESATIFIVARNDNAMHRGQLLSNCSAGGNNQLRYDGSSRRLLVFSDSYFVPAEVTLANDTTDFQILSVLIDASTETINVAQNGVRSGATSITVRPGGAWRFGQIGARCSNEFLEGHIAEILIYNQILGTTDQRTILDYLSQRYGL